MAELDKHFGLGEEQWGMLSDKLGGEEILRKIIGVFALRGGRIMNKFNENRRSGGERAVLVTVDLVRGREITSVTHQLEYELAQVLRSAGLVMEHQTKFHGRGITVPARGELGQHLNLTTGGNWIEMSDEE